MKRKIIEIDEDKCTGCGECIPNCHEGALQIIDDKARLISDLFCDGLGNCIGHCPTGAMKIIEREAEDYDERKVMEENIVPAGENTIKAHLSHLKDHGATKFYDEAILYLKEKGIKELDLQLNGGDLKVTKQKVKASEDKMKEDLPCGCPGSAMREVKPSEESNVEQSSQLRQWPIQLNLLPAHAPFFNDSHLLIAADCVGFANPNFHSKLLHGKSLAIGCPKLDDSYLEKFTEIFKQNNIKSITVAIMEVPCCYGLYSAVEEAVKNSGKKIPIIKEVIGVNGEILVGD